MAATGQLQDLSVLLPYTQKYKAWYVTQVRKEELVLTRKNPGIYILAKLLASVKSIYWRVNEQQSLGLTMMQSYL